MNSRNLLCMAKATVEEAKVDSVEESTSESESKTSVKVSLTEQEKDEIERFLKTMDRSIL